MVIIITGKKDCEKIDETHPRLPVRYSKTVVEIAEVIGREHPRHPNTREARGAAAV